MGPRTRCQQLSKNPRIKVLRIMIPILPSAPPHPHILSRKMVSLLRSLKQQLAVPGTVLLEANHLVLGWQRCRRSRTNRLPEWLLQPVGKWTFASLVVALLGWSLEFFAIARDSHFVLLPKKKGELPPRAVNL